MGGLFFWLKSCLLRKDSYGVERLNNSSNYHNQYGGGYGTKGYFGD